MILNSVYHGGASKVMRTFEDESVNLIVTDPPYGINYKSCGQQFTRRHRCGGDRGGQLIRKRTKDYFKGIIGDEQVPLVWLNQAYRVLKNESAIYVFCHWRTYPVLVAKLVDVGFKVKNLLVMNKTSRGMGDLKGSYAPSYELCIFAVKGRHILKSRLRDVFDVKVLWSGSYHYHPNQKPLLWVTKFITNSSNKGDVVLDPFCGSGSFLLASKKLHRNYVGIDLDKEYYKVSVDRLSK